MTSRPVEGAGRQAIPRLKRHGRRNSAQRGFRVVLDPNGQEVVGCTKRR